MTYSCGAHSLHNNFLLFAFFFFFFFFVVVVVVVVVHFYPVNCPPQPLELGIGLTK